MKEAFLRCMPYMYPFGIENDKQLRDLIKTFSMGYIEGLQKAGIDISHVLEEIKPITDFNYWPDNSWRWWLHDPRVARKN